MSDIRMMKSPPADDGWNDAANEAGERMIRGTILRFADWRWTAGKERTEIEIGTRLVALATAAMWVRWEDGKPVEHRVRQPGQRLPERDELGHDDEDEWEVGPDGEPQDPWQNTRLVYLVDPETAEAFTFSTSSYGGRGAVNDSRRSDRAHAHGPSRRGADRRAAGGEMPTKYGRKSKPLFKVVGWKSADGDKPAPVEREISAVAARREIKRHEISTTRFRFDRGDAMLEPDRDQLEIFVEALFRHAGGQGFVSAARVLRGRRRQAVPDHADKPGRRLAVSDRRRRGRCPPRRQLPAAGRVLPAARDVSQQQRRRREGHRRRARALGRVRRRSAGGTRTARADPRPGDCRSFAAVASGPIRRPASKPTSCICIGAWPSRQPARR